MKFVSNLEILCSCCFIWLLCPCMARPTNHSKRSDLTHDKIREKLVDVCRKYVLGKRYVKPNCSEGMEESQNKFHHAICNIHKELYQELGGLIRNKENNTKRMDNIPVLSDHKVVLGELVFHLNNLTRFQQEAIETSSENEKETEEKLSKIKKIETFINELKNNLFKSIFIIHNRCNDKTSEEKGKICDHLKDIFSESSITPKPTSSQESNKSLIRLKYIYRDVLENYLNHLLRTWKNIEKLKYKTNETKKSFEDIVGDCYN